MIKKLKELSTKPKEKQTMNEREYEELIKLLEDDFDGDFTITRKSLLEYLNKAKWNAKIQIKEELDFLKEIEVAKEKEEE